MSKRKRIVLIVVVSIVVVLLAVAAGFYWMVGPSVRCELPDEAAADAGWTIRTIVSDSVELCYYLYAPPGYDPAQELPVVISFHGFMSNPESHGLITGWHKLAAEEGFLVAYPQGKWQLL